jgi:hypothetical protein
VGNSAIAGGAHRVYVDECEVHRHPRLAKMWQRRGQPVRVPTAGEAKKVAVVGGLADASGRLLWQTSATKVSANFLRFLDQLAAELPDGPVVVVLDTVGDHKSHLLRRWWLAHRDRIRPRWLPAYAPELNRIERVWRHFKDKLSNHRWWADLPAREHATATLLDRMEAHFHRPEAIALRPVHNFCEIT